MGEATNSSVQITSTTPNAMITIADLDVQHSGPVTATVAGTASAGVVNCYFTAVHGHAFAVTGGAWTFNQCTIMGAEVDIENIARGMYLIGRSGESSSFTINHSIFANITNTQGLGGGVYISGGSLSMDSWIFENNRADAGGAL